MEKMQRAKRIAVVIPCYKVTNHVLDVIKKIGPEVSAIYAVDDACPDGSGALIHAKCTDKRVHVLWNDVNKGVGGAVVAGYRAALDAGCDILVKIDGDGQMDPSVLQRFVQPILNGQADYTKGNRFFDLESVRAMPAIRLFGNAVLSFITKFSSGYYQIFDPTNGYTALSASAARLLQLGKISGRYFFESDILFRLNTIGAVVIDVPHEAAYSDEISGLRIKQILLPFLAGHGRNFFKRIIYNYFLRNFSIASIELLLGLSMFFFGVAFGGLKWHEASSMVHFASSGTVMLSALPVILGVQFLLSFLHYDMASTPRRSLTQLFDWEGN